ncbi:MAG TPA: alpha/beta fold hydrolase [Allosphingosinicella sp.]|nr:alpha/beta fold hydrolase [Allosphingosinicella sp.]
MARTKLARTKRITGRRIAAALLLCLLGGLAASWAAGSFMVRGAAGPVTPAPPPAQDFVLTAGDGTRLAATYRPGRGAHGPAVLLLHGVQASRQSTAPNAAWLARQGYATLTIDFRGHGRSELRPRSFGLLEARDAEAALRWLKARQRGAPVAVIGNSLGGAAALLGEAGPLPADALVLQAVYPDLRSAIRNRIAQRLGRAPAWALEPLLSFQTRPRLGVWPARLSPLRAVRRYGGPLLVVGGGADRSTPPAETRALFEAAPGPKALWIVPGIGHGPVGDLRSEDYRRRLLAFFARTIGEP